MGLGRLSPLLYRLGEGMQSGYRLRPVHARVCNALTVDQVVLIDHILPTCLDKVSTSSRIADALPLIAISSANGVCREGCLRLLAWLASIITLSTNLAFASMAQASSTENMS